MEVFFTTGFTVNTYIMILQHDVKCMVIEEGALHC